MSIAYKNEKEWIEAGGSGIVDQELSETSTHAIQNRTVHSHLVVDGNEFYFDNQNGQFGFNTSPDRGADTFHPFKSSGEIQSKVVGTNTMNYINPRIWVDSDILIDAESPSGKGLWTDGTTLYFSSNDSNQHHYQYDPDTKVWSEVFWNDTPYLISRDTIWVDGDNVYNTVEGQTKLLNKETSTWVDKTWYGDIEQLEIGSRIWTDGDNIYYTIGSTSFVLNRETSTWNSINFNIRIEARCIWNDGDHTYYSNGWGAAQYELNKEDMLWEEKTWNNYSGFNGNYIWTDGIDMYASEGSTYKLDRATDTWNQIEIDKVFLGEEVITIGTTAYLNNCEFIDNQWVPIDWTFDFESIANLQGSYIWTDGNNIYYSYYEKQYVLNETDKKWIPKTWTGITEFNGMDIWSDGNNIYYSTGSIQYVLNKSTSIWTIKTWNNFSNITGRYIWTYLGQFYYSYNSAQYVLDIENDSWNKKDWISPVNYVDGEYIWTDGTNSYFSNGTTQYVLNNETNTWERKVWIGLTDFKAENIWIDGIYIYYSNGTSHYELDAARETWSTRIWNGLTNFQGKYVWSDGDDIYYSASEKQYILDRDTNTWIVKTWTGLTEPLGTYFWTDGENLYYSQGSNHYIFNRATSTWSTKTWNGLTRFYGNDIWTDGENIHYSNNSSYILDKESSTWSAVTGWGSVYPSHFWYHNDEIHYDYGNFYRKIFDKEEHRWKDYDLWFGYDGSFQGQYIWYDGEVMHYSDYNIQLILPAPVTSEIKRWEPATWVFDSSGSFYGDSIWSDGIHIYRGQFYILKAAFLEDTGMTYKWELLLTGPGTTDIRDIPWKNGNILYWGNKYLKISSQNFR